ncbi:solute carrier family 35 member G1-like [Apostichopus japonicus]|uniref:solute carrier family 35 member G1-like n=1 Tax=Stichopus japonicus TaxID=307972 RepID=UPI003AB74D33
MAGCYNLTSLKGLAYSISFAVSYAVQAGLAKAMLENGSNAFELVFLRCVIHIAVIVIFTSWEATISYTLVDMFLYICSTITALFAWILMVVSFSYLEIGDSVAIEIGSTVLFTAFVGHIWLCERVDKVDIPILSLTVIGVLLVTKPSMMFEENVDQKQILGAVFALATGLLYSIYPVTVKFIARRGALNIKVFQLCHGITGIPITLVIALFSTPWKPSYSLGDCLMILVYQLFCLAQTSFFALALELEDAKYVAVSSTISCVLTYLAQLTIFKATLDWLAIVGSSLIVSAVILLQIRKIMRSS